MSTLKEIEEAIPSLSLREIAALRASLDRFLEISPREKRRSIRDLEPLSGKWIGETVLKRSELAEEMFGAR